MHRFLQEERILIIEAHFSYGNAKAVRKKWREKYGDEKTPVRKKIYELRDKFRHTGTVADSPRTGRPATTSTRENKNSMRKFVVEEGRDTTIRQLSAEYQISTSSIARILKDIGMKPFHYRTQHGLLEDDPDRRLETCSNFMSRFDDRYFFDRVL